MRRLSGSAVPCVLALVLLSSAMLLSLTAWEGESGSGRGGRVRVSLSVDLSQGSVRAPAGSAGTAAASGPLPPPPPPPPSPLRGLASANLATLGGEGVSCAVALPTPRVALMFLTLGPMPHEALWEAWLRSAGGLVPKASLAAKGAFCLKMCRKGKCVQRCGAEAACNPLCAAALRLQHGSKPALPALAGQSLVSVYVHAPPAFPGYPPASLFHGRLISDRMETSWGTHSLAEAAKRLVGAAVADAANRWFILASETTVPLYSAALFWAQLASERLSRINACPSSSEQDAKASRWSPYMLGDHFRYAHWRKSSQWWILQRRHAELVAGDEEVNAIFRRWCFDQRDEVLGQWRDCISDEHYVPSLLAMHGQDNQTDCRVNGGTAVDWSAGGPHPQTWWAADVREGGAELIERIRRTELNCSFSEAVARAPAAFVDVTELGAGGARACARTLGSKKEWARSGSSFRGGALGKGCPLLVRKFSPAASELLLQLYRDCSKGLGVLSE